LTLVLDEPEDGDDATEMDVEWERSIARGEEERELRDHPDHPGRDCPCRDCAEDMMEAADMMRDMLSEGRW